MEFNDENISLIYKALSAYYSALIRDSDYLKARRVMDMIFDIEKNHSYQLLQGFMS